MRNPTKSEGAQETAWRKYIRGDFLGAEQEATLLLKDADTENAGHYMLALVSHVTGKYTESIRHYDLIKSDYSRKRQLTETIIWSHVHLGDIDGALDCLDEARNFNYRDKAFRTVLECMRTSPMRIEIPTVVELPFTDDPLSPYMPGFDMRINGKRAVARLDTGASFVHVSSALADELGIKTTARTKGFASLSSDTIRYGFADIELGSARIENVPVLVHEKGLSVDPIAKAFGITLGPIVGTNVLEQFLATIDGPGKRLVLSARHDPAMNARHDALLHGTPTSVPFALWNDHYMIVHGSVGDQNSVDYRYPVGMFVDTGLVVVDDEAGQASMLTPKSVLASWNVMSSDNGNFVELPGYVFVGKVSQDHATTHPVGNDVWKRFGDWGGIKVDTLLSWGFLKAYTWTLDFDERRFLFRKP